MESSYSVHAGPQDCKSLISAEQNTAQTYQLQRIQAFRDERTRSPAPGLIPELDGRRLLNRLDWDIALRERSAPWNYYGKETAKDWFDAASYIQGVPKTRAINTALLRDIHRIATKTLFYRGYERRRIEQAARDGRITEGRKAQLLLELDVYRQPVQYSGVDHRLLGGQLRTDALDRLLYKPENRDVEGLRYMTQPELDYLRYNPYLAVDESQVQAMGKGRYLGGVEFTRPEFVEIATAQVLERLNQRLAMAKSNGEIIYAVAELNRDLIAVHPFLDGNGRAVRLLGDLVLQRYGLPPPLYPNDNDLFMNACEAYEYLIEAMANYVDAIAHKKKRG